MWQMQGCSRFFCVRLDIKPRELTNEGGASAETFPEFIERVVSTTAPGVLLIV